MRAKHLRVGLLLGVTLLPASLRAADWPEFPADPRQWINAEPVTRNQLEGKAVVLYFFEEDCPRCSGAWPQRLAVAQQFAGRPVVFIAVSSGTARREIESYARRLRINWPIILDVDRSFERGMGVNEISLENIYQVKYITADGDLKWGDFNDLAETTEKALVGASWSIPPDMVPETLRAAWLSIELKNYPPAAALLKRHLKSKNDDLLAAAELLHSAVQDELDAAIAKMQENLDSGQKWDAYAAIQRIEIRFRGYDLPDVVTDQKRKLSKDPEVVKEQSLFKKLELAMRQVDGGKPSLRSRGLAALERLATEEPGSTAGQRARELLEQSNSPPVGF